MATKDEDNGSNKNTTVNFNWDEIEAKYWASMAGRREEYLTQLDAAFQAEKTPIQEKIVEDVALRDRLGKEEQQLLARLQQVREEKTTVVNRVKVVTEELRLVFDEFSDRKKQFEDNMAAWEVEKREYFATARADYLARRTGNAGTPRLATKHSSSEFALGGPVQAPEVTPISDSGPNGDNSVAEQTPSQQDANGPAEEDANGQAEEDANDQAEENVPDDAEMPDLTTDTDKVETDAETLQDVPAAGDAVVEDEPTELSPLKETVQLQEPAEISPSSTTKDTSEAAGASTDDVAMNDVTIVIREKDAEDEVVESIEESAEAAAPDVVMSIEPNEMAPPQVNTQEESTVTSEKAPLSVVTTKEAPEAGPVSPASSLSSLTSSFADLDQSDSPRLPPKVVEVLDQNQQVVGRLRPLGKDNRSITLITSMPIKRQVQIRNGRHFTSDDLEKVHHPHDQKGAKWISMYIQAVGDVQEHPCDACAKKTGVYQECIMVKNDTFLKCGNCEWNRHACLGAGRASPRGDSRPGSRQSAKIANRPSTPGGFTAINQSFSAAASDAASIDDDGTPLGVKNSITAKKPGARTSLPSSRKIVNSVIPSRQGSPSTPMAGSVAPDGEEPTEDLPPITAENLCLRDDGTVFTDPPLMRGVPLEKIGPDHPYWDPSWEADIAGIISKELKRWTDKFNDMEAQQVNDHRKYEAKRQVNRGNTILDWLENGEFHPYQLVAKPWMNHKKLIKYNTLYRLAQMVANELPLYKLDVKPSDWMRHRLNELFLRDGNEFHLANHVSGFYHDPKVQQVREKAGFTSVGRPHKASTAKKAGAEVSTPKTGPSQRPLKRKDTHPEEDSPKDEQQQQTVRSSPRKIVVVGSSSSATPANQPPPPLAPDASDDEDQKEGIKVHSPPPSRNHIKKKIRLTTNNGSPTPVSTSSADLAVDGYTSFDSCSNDSLQEIDFRVSQVKTPEVATNQGVTQYWHFVAENPTMLEHQVLKQLKPAKWAVFRHPYDFHLRTKELAEIVYGVGSVRVIIRFKRGKNVSESEGRGDMMAEFKRDRTKRRFLKFLGGKGVRILKSSKDYVENAWTELQPKFDMPGNDSE
ncbi:hypothetical protein QBC38DRAFT_36838 [Podospora fimiseda]|uniref:Uncharacterized protein n=1 Tax=Podospora fimiseda TaxID=252190 RepID=A0AAN7BIA1_9PEZI|nr:hypothetical protein QBC38DRAFT_36838 [Podospora fimiseda]